MLARVKQLERRPTGTVILPVTCRIGSARVFLFLFFLCALIFHSARLKHANQAGLNSKCRGKLGKPNLTFITVASGIACAHRVCVEVLELKTHTRNEPALVARVQIARDDLILLYLPGAFTFHHDLKTSCNRWWKGIAAAERTSRDGRGTSPGAPRDDGGARHPVKETTPASNLDSKKQNVNVASVDPKNEKEQKKKKKNAVTKTKNEKKQRNMKKCNGVDRG